MLPDGWIETKLSKIADIKRGAGSQYLTYVDSENDGIRLIRISDFLGDAPKYVKYTKDIERFILDAGDILIAGTGATAGIVFEIPDRFHGLAFSYNVPRIRVTKKVSKAFISYYLASGLIVRQQHSLFTGNAQPFLDTKAIGGFKINLPPLSEQQKIAQILSTWDKSIEKLEALITAKQKRKKALMQQLLTGKKRFAGFEGEWKEIAIRQMGKIVSGGTPDTNIKEYWDGDILWMTPTDVTALKSRFISDTARKITKKGQKDSSATIIPAGSLLVCTRATIGIMSISTTDITTNQGFKNLVPNKSFDVEFLYYLFSHSKDKFIRYACGSTFFELSKKDFEKLTFECPGLQEQQKIASVLSAADTEIQAHQKQLSALKEQKKGLMQQLLTGKKRVKIDLKEVA